MKKSMRLVLMLGLVVAASMTSSPKPAHAILLCESLQGKGCGLLPPRGCRWEDGEHRHLCLHRRLLGVLLV